MDKKKKILIIIGVIALAIALTVTAAFFILRRTNKKAIERKDRVEEKKEEKKENKNILEDPVPIKETTYDYKKKTLTKTNDKQYLVTFDSNGGEEIDDILLDVENYYVTIDLPTPRRDGYIFNGWESEALNGMGTVKIYRDTNLTAAWIPKANNKTMTIKFDTDNLVHFADITVICNKPLSYLPTYIDIEKDGYSFDGWYNDSGTKVTNGSILECKNTTLHANFVKNKYYKCPDGYELKDNKTCIKEDEVKYGCPTGKLYNGICINVDETVTPEITCLQRALTIDGENIFEKGTYINKDKCGYHKYEDINEEEQCNAVKGTWYEDSCYVEVDTYFKASCPGNSYLVEPKKQITELKEVDSPTCFKYENKQNYCAEGYELYQSRNFTYFYDYNFHCIKKEEATIAQR